MESIERIVFRNRIYYLDKPPSISLCARYCYQKIRDSVTVNCWDQNDNYTHCNLDCDTEGTLNILKNEYKDCFGPNATVDPLPSLLGKEFYKDDKGAIFAWSIFELGVYTSITYPGEAIVLAPGWWASALLGENREIMKWIKIK